MQVLIFSDTHFTQKFKVDYYHLLSEQIERADLVIIAGDFWEAYLCSFEQFINSEWQKMFKLLRDKTVYLFGNHDRKEFSDERVNQFCRETGEKYELSLNSGKSLYIIHGNTVSPSWDDRFGIKPGKFLKSLLTLTERFEDWYVSKYGNFKFLDKYNRQAIDWKHKNLNESQILVMGHVHWPVQLESQGYINLGVNKNGIWSFTWVNTETGEISLNTGKF